MSQIITSLQRLNETLEKLEGAVDFQEEQILKLKQQDLFSDDTPQDNVIAMNPALVAQKLDSAIEKVEQILKEAS